jgi:hypothetical protein
MIAGANNIRTALATFAQRAAEFAVIRRGTVAGRVGALFFLFVCHDCPRQFPSAFHANHYLNAAAGSIDANSAPHYRTTVPFCSARNENSSHGWVR